MFRNFLMSMIGLFSLATTPVADTTTPEPVVETNVMDDLNKDPNFVRDKDTLYPRNDKDFSIDVIQLGMNSANELYVYVYVPAAEVRPIEFNSIHLSLDEKYLDFNSYNLKYINADTVFYKLKVLNLDLGKSATKHIGITSIYRNYNPDIGDTIDQLYTYNISQKWVIDNVGGKLNYYMNELVTYEIKNSYQGWVRYKKNMNIFYNDSCDGHFIAFKQDPKYKIDRLMEADIIYEETKHKVRHTILGASENQGYPIVEEGKKTLTYDESASVSNNQKFAWFKRTFTWKRILTAEEFVKQQNKDGITFEQEASDNLKQYDYVLSFLETPFSDEYDPAPVGSPRVNHTVTYSSVNATSIVRLKFEQDGKTYNLPVIDDKHDQPAVPDGNHDLNPTPDTVITNAKNWWDDMIAWLKEQGEGFVKLLKVLLLICGLLLFAKPIEWIFKGIKSIFTWFKDMMK